MFNFIDPEKLPLIKSWCRCHGPRVWRMSKDRDYVPKDFAGSGLRLPAVT